MVPPSEDGMINADVVIKTGFWMQLVLLALIDLGTLNAFAAETVPWYHYVGFVTVNVVLLALSAVVWRWLRDERSPQV